MVIVEVTSKLKVEMRKKFKSQAVPIFEMFKTLEENPKKGDILIYVGKFVVKELKYKKFRFYFITNGHLLQFGTEAELATLLIKFVRMSEKKDQQKTIEEIKKVLRKMGFGKS